LILVFPKQAMKSILHRQKNRRATAICFRDDPEPRAVAHAVGRQNPPAVFQTQFVLAPVVLLHISPIPADMPDQVDRDIITGCLERFQSTRSDVKRTGRELDAAHPRDPSAKNAARSPSWFTVHRTLNAFCSDALKPWHMPRGGICGELTPCGSDNNCKVATSSRPLLFKGNTALFPTQVFG